MRKYFVSFVVTGNIRFDGCIVIERKTPIVDADDVYDISKEIKKVINKEHIAYSDTVIITNWRPMELPE